MKFSSLIIEHTGVQEYTLFSDLIYENTKIKITVMKGFKSDGASIPTILHGIVGCPFGEKYTKAAVIHDAMYRSGVFDRKTSDYLFLEMMFALGVERPKARAMYLAVRAGGESSYLGMGNISEYRDLIKIEVKNDSNNI